MKKKERDFRYFWEQSPVQEIKKSTGNAENLFGIQPAFTEMSFQSGAVSVNVSETDKEVIVEARLPGFRKNEISLQVAGNIIQISAQKKKTSEQKGKGFYVKKVGSAAVSRSFTLPANVDTKKIEAALEDDILRIKMAKLHPGKKKKRIYIKEES